MQQERSRPSSKISIDGEVRVLDDFNGSINVVVTKKSPPKAKVRKVKVMKEPIRIMSPSEMREETEKIYEQKKELQQKLQSIMNSKRRKLNE